MEMFTSELISSLIGLVIGFVFKYLIDKVKEAIRNKPINLFFRSPKSKLLIIHSAIFDKDRNAYDYPACDTKAARLIASRLTKIGLNEGKDFRVVADADLLKDKSNYERMLKENDLIVLCSPKRNYITKMVLENLNNLRYQPVYDEQKKLNYIKDRLNNVDLISSEDKSERHFNLECIDYGLLISAPNPFNVSKRVVIISGNHGEGTLGVAEYIQSDENVKKLLSREEQKKIEELIVVKYCEPEIISTKIMA